MTRLSKLGVLLVLAAGLLSAKGGHRVAPGHRHTARIKRSRSSVKAFKKAHPCPANGGSGACPGYVVDHVVPLKRGGSDTPSNMQWQTIEEGKAKDKEE